MVVQITTHYDISREEVLQEMYDFAFGEIEEGSSEWQSFEEWAESITDYDIMNYLEDCHSYDNRDFEIW